MATRRGLRTLGVAATLGPAGLLGGRFAKLGETIPVDLPIAARPSAAGVIPIVITEALAPAGQTGSTNQPAQVPAPTTAPPPSSGEGGDGAGGDGGGAAGPGGDSGGDSGGDGSAGGSDGGVGGAGE